MEDPVLGSNIFGIYIKSEQVSLYELFRISLLVIWTLNIFCLSHCFTTMKDLLHANIFVFCKKVINTCKIQIILVSQNLSHFLYFFDSFYFSITIDILCQTLSNFFATNDPIIRDYHHIQWYLLIVTSFWEIYLRSMN